MFAIYCVESKASFSTDLTYYQKRHLLLDSNQKEAKERSGSSGNDLLPTNLVLVSTLDGSIRGIDRFEGRVHWTLKGGPGSSLIKSNSHFETHKFYKQGSAGSVHSAEEDEHDKLFVDTLNTMDTDEDSTTDDELDEFNLDQHPWEDSEDSEEQDIYYIIEPQDGGSLYIYGDGRPLEKLPFSVKEIVNNSPFRTPDGTTYIGRKNTLMIEIDPRNGKILQQIDLNKADNQYRMATQYPPRTIFLEYKVAIYDNNKKWWNVTYSEYIPNKFDWDVPTNTVPSDIYVAPDATLAITGINVRNGELIWSRDLPHPVVSVFDVYRREDYTIALSKQVPPPTLTKGDVGDLLSLMTRKNNVTSAYVGVHEGSLYALSTKNYPLVQISPWASMYTGRKPGDTSQLIGGSSTSDANATGFEWTQKPHEMCCHGCEYHIDCMIGQHVVQSVVDEIVEEDHIFRYKLSLPSASSSSLPTGLPQSLPTNIPLYHLDYEERKSSFFQEGFGRFWKSYVLVSSVIVYVYRDHIITFYEVKVLPKWKQMLKKRAKAKKTKARIAAAARAEKEMIKRERADSLTPTADTILSHPFFWTTSKRLAFLQDASDRFEIEEREPPSLLLRALESDASTVIGTDWYKRIDRIVANDLGKYRKYDGKRVRDLLRALRNKKHHWQDLPPAVKLVYGEPPNQFLYYFTARFPHLLLHTYYVVASQPSLRKEGSLGQYF
ncbi:hypothetical protein INT48_009149 [Thamnidium elegans]|uniref:non-specific serine/threonine protein kinase n=1 Tax=Thamnidium elegans TaxID=101142 RepID=A0A8H7W249_9FUNG|nr:hypothetical protein INT48_009149 [Thamnidium elegans]